MENHMIITFTSLITVLMQVMFFSSVSSVEVSTDSPRDICIAIAEMQRANYFAFAMLINMMSPSDPRLSENVTFLMPKDRMLSKSAIPENSVSKFLLRHSIPSPLLFGNLNLVPNGSMIPSSLPNYSLKIWNGGRRNYFLNNVRIVSPNICTLGSIKCHGVDGVLSVGDNGSSPVSSSPSNRNSSQRGRVSSSPSAPSQIPPAMAPSPLDDPKPPQNSESPGLYVEKVLGLIATVLVLQIFGGYM